MSVKPTSPELDQGFLKDHFQLPPLPEVVATLLQRIQSGDATAGEIAELLTADVGLVAQVLKIVNSAYYSLPRAITEAKHAVAYLGLGEIERVAMTATVMKELAPEDPQLLRDFWFHSFYSSLISKRIQARYARGLDADELHTAVLLHDVGKLIYMRFFPEQYAELRAKCRSEGILLVDAERALDYPSHQTLGELLCERWNLPATVRRACLQHELDDLTGVESGAPHAEELRLVAASNLLANLAAEDLSVETKQRIREATTATLGCGDQDFLLLMGELYELKSEAEGFLRQL